MAAYSEPMQAAGVEWSEHVVHTNFEGIRKTFSKRLAYDVPPTASFWIGGGSAVDELIEQGVFRKIVPNAGDEHFAGRLLPEVFEAVRHGDGLSSLPVGIHLQNFIVYNGGILNEIGEAIPSNWTDFLRVAEKAKQAGYSGLSLSDQKWQLRFLLGSMMSEHLNPQELQLLASKNRIGGAQRRAIEASFDMLDRLRPYLNSDFRNLNWKHAVDHVIHGRAMANVLGDFVTPLLNEQRDLICALPPGNEYVTWSFDSIVLTATEDPGELAGQHHFTSVIFDPANAARYIERKGGVPVVIDFNTEAFPPCAKLSVDLWQQSPSRVLLSTPEWTRSMSMIASFGQQFLDNPQVELAAVTAELFATLEALRKYEAAE